MVFFLLLLSLSFCPFALTLRASAHSDGPLCASRNRIGSLTRSNIEADCPEGSFARDIRLDAYFDMYPATFFEDRYRIFEEISRCLNKTVELESMYTADPTDFTVIHYNVEITEKNVQLLKNPRKTVHANLRIIINECDLNVGSSDELKFYYVKMVWRFLDEARIARAVSWTTIKFNYKLAYGVLAFVILLVLMIVTSIAVIRRKNTEKKHVSVRTMRILAV